MPGAFAYRRRCFAGCSNPLRPICRFSGSESASGTCASASTTSAFISTTRAFISCSWATAIARRSSAFACRCVCLLPPDRFGVVAPMFLPTSTSAMSIERISNAARDPPLVQHRLRNASGFSSTFLWLSAEPIVVTIPSPTRARLSLPLHRRRVGRCWHARSPRATDFTSIPFLPPATSGFRSHSGLQSFAPLRARYGREVDRSGAFKAGGCRHALRLPGSTTRSTLPPAR